VLLQGFAFFDHTRSRAEVRRSPRCSPLWRSLQAINVKGYQYRKRATCQRQFGQRLRYAHSALQLGDQPCSNDG
jgi:hypothetical protein